MAAPGGRARVLVWPQRRLARPSIKVLYTSGYTDDDLFHQEADTARLAFLARPFTTASLARTVREILDGDGA